MDVAVLTMLSSMFAAILAMFWHLIRENTKTRDLMVRLNHDTRAELRVDHKELRKDLDTLGAELRVDHKELRKDLNTLGAELRADHKELRKDLDTLGAELRADHKSLADELRADHKSLADELRVDHKSLADELRVGLSGVRERLSRIEGHLGIGIDPPTLQPDE